MTVHVRFAPSPTGRLHVGNARAAVLNWLFARRHGGRFLFRLDDTDTDRSTEAFATGIADDLRWLGLTWDSHFRQSDRLDVYHAAAERLKASGRLYPCYETPEELELRRKLQLARRLPPVYDRAALKLTDADRAKLEAEGRKPHWRFKLEQSSVHWHDLIRGDVTVDAASLSDPVLLRADGRVLYTMSSVVDDGDTAITHVIRGEDHVTNTGVQIQLFEALDYAVPQFAHFSLFTDTSGAGLSKRLGSLSLTEMREGGIEAMALNAFLARLGSADPIEVRHSLDELVEGFDLGRFGKAPAHFDPAELDHLNARLVHGLSFAEVADRLPAFADEAFWLAVRGNLAHVPEALEWWQVVNGPIEPAIEEADYLAAAAAVLPPAPWDGDTWKAWTEAVKAATGLKGKALFLPLRRALTARDHGPEMKDLLPLIGEDRARARLRGEKA